MRGDQITFALLISWGQAAGVILGLASVASALILFRLSARTRATTACLGIILAIGAVVAARATSPGTIIWSPSGKAPTGEFWVGSQLFYGSRDSNGNPVCLSREARLQGGWQMVPVGTLLGPLGREDIFAKDPALVSGSDSNDQALVAIAQGSCYRVFDDHVMG